MAISYLAAGSGLAMGVGDAATTGIGDAATKGAGDDAAARGSALKPEAILVLKYTILPVAGNPIYRSSCCQESRY